ncbi:MAG: hypothetical protein RL514_2296 [Verrucomicrobiota bacterium]|jgi:hypothetical protein
MNPSLLSLFKRGQYLRSRSTLASTTDGASSEERQERERFLTAAIGFVAQHDKSAFGHHLLSVLNRVEAVSPLVEGGFEVKIEYPVKGKFLDLVIEEHQSTGTAVHVIEVKLGAGLAPHQDPSKAEFWQAGEGYGSLICAEFQRTKAIRYWVLGHDEPFTSLAHHGQHPNWKGSQLFWSDLAEGFPESSLADDLHRLLATLGIGPFMMKETESLQLSSNVSVAAKAYRVFEDTCATFGLHRKHRDMECNSDGSTWHFGMELRSVQNAGKRTANQMKLTQTVAPKAGGPAAWFGYEQDDRGFDLDVWFYCGNPEKKNEIKDKLLLLLNNAVDLNKRSDKDFICVSKSDKTPDRKWLTNVFKAIGMEEVCV